MNVEVPDIDDVRMEVGQLGQTLAAATAEHSTILEWIVVE
jgi:hypothetical protein